MVSSVIQWYPVVSNGNQWYWVIINGNSTCITPIQASKLLFDYKGVGIIVYGCNVSSSESNYVNQTLLLVLLECIDIKFLNFLDYAILIG